MFIWNKRPNHRLAPFYLSNVDAHTTLFQYVQFIDLALKPCTKYSVGAYGLALSFSYQSTVSPWHLNVCGEALCTWSFLEDCAQIRASLKRCKEI